LAGEAIPSRFVFVRFAESIEPELAHREGLWPWTSVKKMLCGIIKITMEESNER
jgi:hypothetical protein